MKKKSAQSKGIKPSATGARRLVARSVTRPSKPVMHVVNAPLSRRRKIESGAKDFALRFEGVMRELANG